jgi:hypothetical protein
MTISTFTTVHVILSLIGILAGLIALYGMVHSNPMRTVTALFLAMTVATVVTGFFFPFTGVTPAFITGIATTIFLVPALAGLYLFHLQGDWRSLYVIGAVVSLYLNSFALVVQSFLKIPVFNALAPEGTEPPLLIAQGAVLIFFIAAGILAYRRFHPLQPV